mgnify:CR=1 FL=1
MEKEPLTNKNEPVDTASSPGRPEKLYFFRIFLRSFLLQTILNYPRMQGLGFGLALAPLGKKIKLRGRELSDYLRRHLKFFNAHPYMAPYAMGAVMRLEWDRQPETKVESLKRTLVGPLGLFGDQVFWTRFRPLAGLTTVLAILIFLDFKWKTGGIPLGIGAILAAFLIGYNYWHLRVRWEGLITGFEYGENILGRITRSLMVKLRLYLSLAGALIAGLLAAKAYNFSPSKSIFLVSFAVIFIGLKLKTPLWLLIIIASTACLGLTFTFGLTFSE